MSDNNPQISVVIPTRNRRDVLIRVLKKLAMQACRPELFEIVLVDDNSNDGTYDEIIRSFSKSKTHINYILQKQSGAGAARNRGVREAQGDWILFLDADLIPEQDVIERHLRFHLTQCDALTCLMGAVEMSPDLRIPSQFRHDETRIQADGNGIQKVSFWQFRTGNTSLSRNLLIPPGGFDYRLEAAEDTELAYRLQASGVRFFYDDSIKVVHHHPMSWEDYIEKNIAYGRSVALWYYECPEVHRDLALRYGVYARELPVSKKIKYILRKLLVNHFTVYALRIISARVRNSRFLLSEKLNRSIVQYYCRRSFRMRISELVQKSLHIELLSNDVKKFAVS